jgi:hypothetical protein
MPDRIDLIHERKGLDSLDVPPPVPVASLEEPIGPFEPTTVATTNLGEPTAAGGRYEPPTATDPAG